MVKRFLVAAMAMMMTVGLWAQGVQETVVTVGELTVPALTMNFDKSDAKTVQEAVKMRLAEANMKTKTIEGYLAVAEQVIPELAAVPVTFYAKVAEQGKKKDKVTVLTVCVTTNDLTIDQNTLKANLETYLRGFPPYIDKYEASLIMAKEQENLKKAEKAAAAAASTVAGYEKSIASSQKKIADKRQEIEKLNAKIKECEQDIKDLEKSIEKDTAKKAEAEKKAAEADAKVDAAKGEVERYRQIAE